jgi:hypothetical protein
MTFEYKNNIELDKLKKSSTISVLCNQSNHLNNILLIFTKFYLSPLLFGLIL